MMPPGYTLLRRGSVRVLVRHDVVTRLGGWLVAPELAAVADAEPIASGRGGAFRTRARGGLRIVVRPCRRGGWIGRLLGSVYLGWRPRPWRELAASIEARARAVPTPAILGVRVAGWGIYRGVVVTEEAADTMTLADALTGVASPDERVRLARAAGEAVGRLHAAGVEHADLNLTNILVPKDGAEAAALVIDLDKARLRRAPLAAASRRRNLRRLCRSWCRLTGQQTVSADLLAGFREGYRGVDGPACAS